MPNNKLLTPVRYNVLFLASWYPNRIHPSTGIFIKRHAQSLGQYCEVRVLHITSDPNLTHATYDIDFVTEESIPVVRVYYKKIKSDIFILSDVRKLFRYIRAGAKGYILIKKKFNKPDLVHLNVTFPAGIVALLFKIFFKLPYIITENWTGYLSNTIAPYEGSVIKFLTRQIVKNAKAVTPVSIELKEAMLNHNLDNDYIVVPNVVNTNLFCMNNEKKNRSLKRILHVSTLLDAHKNVSGILHVIKKLSLIRQDFELNIIDDGNCKDNFIKLSQQFNIYNKFVFFLGYKAGPEIAEFMRTSDFFVLFSNYENLPCVLIESISCGLPVIATKVGGIPEHITKERGILIEPKNEDALLNAVIHMLDHSSEYNPHHLREYAINNFSYEKVGQQFLNIYRDKIFS